MRLHAFWTRVSIAIVLSATVLIGAGAGLSDVARASGITPNYAVPPSSPGGPSLSCYPYTYIYTASGNAYEGFGGGASCNDYAHLSADWFANAVYDGTTEEEQQVIHSDPYAYSDVTWKHLPNVCNGSWAFTETGNSYANGVRMAMLDQASPCG